jgi:WD40 repeat protein
VSFTPDGRGLIAVGPVTTVKCWDVATWRLRHEYAWYCEPLKCLAIAPDGLRAAAGSDKGKMIIWDLDD